ncbi:hypothetical protein M0804_010082 [Polistes exclamans]|nr:hypothetical protein M0804_010082 [Polistes exclamans]
MLDGVTFKNVKFTFAKENSENSEKVVNNFFKSKVLTHNKMYKCLVHFNNRKKNRIYEEFPYGWFGYIIG